MRLHEAIAAFLLTQLDFTLFFYGLAFILLGTVAVSVARHPGQRAVWIWLALFGFVHGTCELLDLVAFMGWEHPAFRLTRVILTASSFLLLLEFGWRRAVPPGWPASFTLHILLVLVVGASGWIGGETALTAMSRYAIALPAGLVVAAMFFLQGRQTTGPDRRLAWLTALLFALFGIFSGLFVAEAPLGPANAIYESSFLATTGIPVQLIRGLLACGLAFCVWGLSARLTVAEIGSAVYTARLLRHGIASIVAVNLILVLGFMLTQFFGNIDRSEVEASTRADLDLLAHRFSGPASATSGIAKMLAESVALRALINGSDRQRAQRELDLGVAAANAAYGAVLDHSGQVVATSGRGAPDDTVQSSTLRPVQAALAGAPDAGLSWIGPNSGDKFIAAEPIRHPDGSIAGAVVIAKPVTAQTDYPGTYFLLSPEGVILQSNVPGAVMRPMWPLDEAARASAEQRFGPLTGSPLLKQEISKSGWTADVSYEQSFVMRAFLNDGPWSLILMIPSGQLHVSRMLGIMLTCLIGMVALILMFGREQNMRDHELRDQRSDLQELADALRSRASTDTLTRLHNREKFNEALAKQIVTSKLFSSAFALIIYDIDHFKQINDAHGHQAGDAVLVDISRLVTEAIGDHELLARWGGEEFVLLAPGRSANAAHILAEELRMKVEAMVFGQVGRITCSFGIAQYVANDTSDTLLARADAALYRAKANGRNRTEMGIEAEVRSVA